MDLIDQFIARYRKEYDFYDQAARLAAQLVERNLQNAGIRAIVTARAKSPIRLEQKVRQRNLEKRYGSVEDIFSDIVDLAGVRIALYFPGERDQVGKVISQLFISDQNPKQFPQDSKRATYTKRFSGYWAVHYRVRHRESSLSEAEKRYAEALLEIQVASVLMHSWAEVEHDLVYKPLQGNLSDDEHAILDELNGLVIAGEIALERLQRAGESRVAVIGRPFSNHYDLAAFLLNQAAAILRTPDPEALLGRVNILYQLLLSINKATPDAIQPYLDSLTADFERRPLADQIIDKLLAESADRYKIYNELRVKESGDMVLPVVEEGEDVRQAHTSVGRFITSWIKLEHEIRQRAQSQYPNITYAFPTAALIRNLQILDPETLSQVDRIRRFRNLLVHGIEIPSAADIDDATHSLDLILRKLQGPTKRRPAKRQRRRK